MGYVIVMMWGMGSYWGIWELPDSDQGIYLTKEECYEALSNIKVGPDYGLSNSCMRADQAKRLVDLHMSKYEEPK